MIAGTTTPKCLEPRQKTRKATLPTFALVTQVTFLVALAGRWDPSQNIRANPIQIPGGPLVWKSLASRSVLVGTVQGGGYDCRFTSEDDFL